MGNKLNNGAGTYITVIYMTKHLKVNVCQHIQAP